MAKIGYVRISTEDQHLDRQIAMMDEIGVDKIFQDQASGKTLKRPGFESLMKYLRSGDELYVESFSRLSRSTTELLNTVEELQKRNVDLISQKESIDTTTPSGRLMLTVFAGMSQFERESMRERQREGIAEAKKRGVYKGRKRIEDSPELRIALKGWQTGELTAVQAARVAGVSRATLYNRISELGLKRQK